MELTDIEILSCSFSRGVLGATNEICYISLSIFLFAIFFELKKVFVNLFSLLLGDAVLKLERDNVSDSHGLASE